MDKIALVTGGGRGIGRAVVAKLCAEGFHVLINYRSNDAEAQVALDSVKDLKGSAELLKFDVANKAEVDAVLGAWLEKNNDKTISVLVNNAGIRKDSLFMWMEPEQWSQVIDININGFYYVTKHLISPMMYKKFGRIINIVSVSGLTGVPGQTNYSAGKAAVIGATKSLSKEVARRGITVNAVAPGFIKTDMTEDLNEKELKAVIPVGRFGEAEEVADLVAFLASEKSGYITGEVISINGGMHT